MAAPLAALNIALKSNALTLSNMKVNEKLADAFQKMSKDENAKNMKEGFGSLEKAVEGGQLENAAKELMKFIDIQSAIAPGMKVLLTELKADTTGARMELMQSVFELIKTQGVQDGLKVFGTIVNNFLGIATSIADVATTLATPTLPGQIRDYRGMIVLTGDAAADATPKVNDLNAAINAIGGASDQAINLVAQEWKRFQDTIGVTANGMTMIATTIAASLAVLTKALETLFAALDKFNLNPVQINTEQNLRPTNNISVQPYNPYMNTGGR